MLRKSRWPRQALPKFGPLTSSPRYRTEKTRQSCSATTRNSAPRLDSQAARRCRASCGRVAASRVRTSALVARHRTEGDDWDAYEVPRHAVHESPAGAAAMESGAVRLLDVAEELTASSRDARCRRCSHSTSCGSSNGRASCSTGARRGTDRATRRAGEPFATRRRAALS